MSRAAAVSASALASARTPSACSRVRAAAWLRAPGVRLRTSPAFRPADRPEVASVLAGLTAIRSPFGAGLALIYPRATGVMTSAAKCDRSGNPVLDVRHTGRIEGPDLLQLEVAGVKPFKQARTATQDHRCDR